MKGMAESSPTIRPPSSAGLSLLFIALVLTKQTWIVNKIADFCRQFLLGNLYAIAGLKLGIFDRAAFDVLNAITNRCQLAVGSGARDLDAVFFQRNAASRENRLEQSDARLKHFLSREIDPSADVIELFGFV